MFESFDETLWLNVTNIGLGVVTIICCLAIGIVFGKETLERAKRKTRLPSIEDDHAFVFGDLGITMADGGKVVDEKEVVQKNKNHHAGEPPTTRSDN